MNPRVVNAKCQDNFKILLTFTNKEQRIVDDQLSFMRLVHKDGHDNGSIENEAHAFFTNRLYNCTSVKAIIIKLSSFQQVQTILACIHCRLIGFFVFFNCIYFLA